jgi:hypothetical protein
MKMFVKRARSQVVRQCKLVMHLVFIVFIVFFYVVSMDLSI